MAVVGVSACAQARDSSVSVGVDASVGMTELKSYAGSGGRVCCQAMNEEEYSRCD